VPQIAGGGTEFEMDPDTSRIGQLLDEAIERGRPEMRVEAASAPVLVRNNGSRSVRIEPPLSCPSGLDGLNGRCSIRDQSIDHPRRRTSRRGAEVGGQSDTGVIYSCRPALGTPPLCHLDDRRRVLDLLSGSLHNEIELVGRHAQVHRGSRARFLPFRVCSPVSNQKASSTQSAPTPVKCGLPS